MPGQNLSLRDISDVNIQLPVEDESALVYDADTGKFVARPAAYKVYTALLSQEGNNAPTAIVLENTLGGIPVWSYHAVGEYDITLAGIFTQTKTGILTSFDGGSLVVLSGARLNSDVIRFNAFSLNDMQLVDESIALITTEIRVYP